MWPLPAPAHFFSVGVGLSFVLLCRLSRVPCPLFCLELTSLWQLPLSFLDSHQDSFCSVFTGSDICWSSQVVCGDPSGVFLGYVCCLTCFPCLAFGLTLVGLYVLRQWSSVLS